MLRRHLTNALEHKAFTRYYSSLGDLMKKSSKKDETIDSTPSTTPLSQRLQQRRDQEPDFSEFTEAWNLEVKTPPTSSRPNRWDLVERGASLRKADVRRRQERLGGGRDQRAESEEEAFRELGEEQARRTALRKGGEREGSGSAGRRRRARTAPLSVDRRAGLDKATLVDKPIPTGPKKVSGVKRGMNRKSASLFGEGGEEDQDSAEDGEFSQSADILAREEKWYDVDADTMRVLRQMMAWRNPVENPLEEGKEGEPTLFHGIKSGYDVYSEERTVFKLGDESATWGSNRPTSSWPNMLGGLKGDYSEFLGEDVKALAGRDLRGLKPLEVVKFNLAKAVDITPRQRENVLATVEGALSKA